MSLVEYKLHMEVLKPDQYNLWNDFVDISPQGDVFCYTWWLEAITKFNFKIFAIIENGKIVAGMPVAFNSHNKVDIPPLTRTLGILYRNNVHESKQKQASAERRWLSELIKYIPLDGFVQMCMHHNFTDWLPFRWNGFNQTTRYTYIIDYNKKTIPVLWSNLDKLRKRTIKRAIENQIKVGYADEFSLVYRFASLAYKRQGLKFLIPYNDLKTLDDAIISNGNRVIFTAGDNTRVHAVLYAAYNRKSAYYLLSGSDPGLRKLGGHTLVLWEAIKFFIDKVQYFNFGGSDVERIESHIRGFGGIQTPYYHVFNENLLAAKNSLRYHIEKILFHIKAVFKVIPGRFLKSFLHRKL